jgi:Dyggve-Melchior-Clausen syndrome protein
MAALTIHLTRLFQEYIQTSSSQSSSAVMTTTNGIHTAEKSASQFSDPVQAFSNRISVVEKARALAGALNVYRILMHSIIVAYSTADDDDLNRQQYDPMGMIFIYQCRETNTTQENVAVPMVQALMQFLCLTTPELPSSSTIGSEQNHSMFPEVYDCYTLALQLFLVLLSSQLYQPLQSSFQRVTSQQQQPSKKNTASSNDGRFNFWQILMEEASRQAADWHPRSMLSTLLHWHVYRPAAPKQSIQHHHCTLMQHVVAAKGEAIGPDRMYESHFLVHATLPDKKEDVHNEHAMTRSGNSGTLSRSFRSNRALLDATRGVLVLSSQIILLLPLRLMSLALSLWGLHHPNEPSNKLHDSSFAHHIQQQYRASTQRRTRDVLFLSNSPLADLSTSLLLILTNNERAVAGYNLFRQEFYSLEDNRWDYDFEKKQYDLPDLPEAHNESLLHTSFRSNDGMAVAFNTNFNDGETTRKALSSHLSPTLTINFEALFASFGRSTHTEPGALWLYTLMQLSPSFASAVSVRSDLDTIVLPILRTLYYSTSTQFHVASQQDYQHRGLSRSPSGNRENIARSRSDSTARSSGSAGSQLLSRDFPFRSPSQLYVIVILLLLFSQDASFGSDAFRRVLITSVPWYKDRHLKDISLGSVLILTLLRSLAFTLTRLHDPFLLSNCCAVLMNLSSSIVDLHDYAAMRLVASTVSVIKKYLAFRQQNPDDDESDLTTLTSMYGEASRTLLCVLKLSLGPKNIDKNLHLVYSLLYHQSDFQRFFVRKGKLAIVIWRMSFLFVTCSHFLLTMNRRLSIQFE